MNWLKTYIGYFKGNHATGIDITLISDEKILANVVVLQKKKNTLEIVKQCTELSSFEELLAEVNPAYPVFLSIDGKGIVHRPMQFNDNDDANISKHVNQLFPNFSETDFWIQKRIIDSQNVYISLARKELIRNIADQFNNHKLFIYNIFLGPFAINHISFLLSGYDKLSINSSEINLHNGLISQFNKAESETAKIDYIIDSETISSQILLAYAASFCFFTGNSFETIASDSVIKSRSDFLYKKAFTLMGYAAIVMMFSGLLLNFIFFDRYNKRLSELMVESNQSKDLANQLSNLRKELKEKESFFLDNKFLETSRASYYADRIAFALPSSIKLNQLFIFPMEKNLSSRDEMKFKSNLIILSGYTSSAQDINNWFHDLKKEKWIKELNLANFRQKESINKTEFEVEITIK